MTSPLADLKDTLEHPDLGRLLALARRVDLPKLLKTLAALEPDDVNRLLAATHTKHKKRPLPAVNGDFYDVASILTPDEEAIRLRVREFMEREIAPIADEYWLRGEFPHHIIPP